MVGRASPGEKQDLRSSVGVSNLDTLNRLGTSCVGHQPEPSPTTTFGRHLRSVKPENKV